MLIVGSSTPTKNSVTWNPKDLARRITSTLLGCDITVSKLKLVEGDETDLPLLVGLRLRPMRALFRRTFEGSREVVRIDVVPEIDPVFPEMGGQCRLSRAVRPGDDKQERLRHQPPAVLRRRIGCLAADASALGTLSPTMISPFGWTVTKRSSNPAGPATSAAPKLARPRARAAAAASSAASRPKRASSLTSRSTARFFMPAS